MELLRIGDSVSKFRQALKENPHFLQDKVKQYFKVNNSSVCVCVRMVAECLYLMIIHAALCPINSHTHYKLVLQENTHRLTLSMSPDEAYLEKQAKAEEEKLQTKIQALSDSDREEIYKKGNINYVVQQVRNCFPNRLLWTVNTGLPGSNVKQS